MSFNKIWLLKCIRKIYLPKDNSVLGIQSWRTLHGTHYLRNEKGAEEENNYYDDLNLDSTATSKDVKTAYIELSKEFHPDRNPGDPEAAIKFQEISEAYATLGNSKLRRMYDRGTLGRLSSVADREAAKHKFDGSAFVDVRI